MDEMTPLDLLAYEYSRESEAYDPHLDISVVAPSGQHVASCVGFVDRANNIAEIERICTHSDHRRRLCLCHRAHLLRPAPRPRL